MMLHFEMRFDHDAGEDLPSEWNLEFTYDDRENEITFDRVRDTDCQEYEWLEFLGMVGKEADGDFVNHLHKLAEAHVTLNLDDAYNDQAQED